MAEEVADPPAPVPGAPEGMLVGGTEGLVVGTVPGLFWISVVDATGGWVVVGEVVDDAPVVVVPATVLVVVGAAVVGTTGWVVVDSPWVVVVAAAVVVVTAAVVVVAAAVVVVTAPVVVVTSPVVVVTAAVVVVLCAPVVVVASAVVVVTGAVVVVTGVHDVVVVTGAVVVVWSSASLSPSGPLLSAVVVVTSRDRTCDDRKFTASSWRTDVVVVGAVVVVVEHTNWVECEPGNAPACRPRARTESRMIATALRPRSSGLLEILKTVMLSNPSAPAWAKLLELDNFVNWECSG